MLCLLGESHEPEQVQVQPMALHPQLLRPKARLTLRPGSCCAHAHKLAAQGLLNVAPCTRRPERAAGCGLMLP
jgi:transcriptional regulator GlxA family with amidase domain